MSLLPEAFRTADELGAQGRYFEAHEELEALWMKAGGEEKILLQGLIQLAAGLHRLKENPTKTDGAFYLLDRGLLKLARTRALVTPASHAALDAAVRSVRASGRAPSSFLFSLVGA